MASQKVRSFGKYLGSLEGGGAGDRGPGLLNFWEKLNKNYVYSGFPNTQNPINNAQIRP